MVEGGEQEALGRILNQPLSFKEPQSNLEQTQVNVENMPGVSPTRGGPRPRGGSIRSCDRRRSVCQPEGHRP